jgi:hypothetical protein
LAELSIAGLRGRGDGKRKEKINKSCGSAMDLDWRCRIVFWGANEVLFWAGGERGDAKRPVSDVCDAAAVVHCLTGVRRKGTCGKRLGEACVRYLRLGGLGIYLSEVPRVRWLGLFEIFLFGEGILRT